MPLQQLSYSCPGLSDKGLSLKIQGEFASWAEDGNPDSHVALDQPLPLHASVSSSVGAATQ